MKSNKAFGNTGIFMSGEGGANPLRKRWLIIYQNPHEIKESMVHRVELKMHWSLQWDWYLGQAKLLTYNQILNHTCIAYHNYGAFIDSILKIFIMLRKWQMSSVYRALFPFAETAFFCLKEASVSLWSCAVNSLNATQTVSIFTYVTRKLCFVFGKKFRRRNILTGIFKNRNPSSKEF